uniref:DUF8040 domain-containing protein n=1 Tax=Chenopodium quinoa TaxID=63459 RepID=A0A803ND91_CHEQI
MLRVISHPHAASLAPCRIPRVASLHCTVLLPKHYVTSAERAIAQASRRFATTLVPNRRIASQHRVAPNDMSFCGKADPELALKTLGEMEEKGVKGDFEELDVENGEVTWERTRRGAVIQVVGYVVYAMCLIKSYHLSRSLERLTRNRSLEAYMVRESRRHELMNDLKVTRISRQLIRMSPETFVKLCKILRDGKYLKDTRRASVEEQVAKSLYILGHNAINCSLSAFFMRSGKR